MAIIPYRERRPLVSSAVGTPGMDTSKIEMAQSIGQAASKLSAVASDVYKFQEKNREKKIEEAKQGTDWLENSVNLNSDINNFETKFKNDNLKDPDKGITDYLKGIQKITENKSNFIKDPIVREAFIKTSKKDINNRVQSYRKWATEQNRVNITQSLASSYSSLEKQMYNANTPEEVEAAMKSYNDLNILSHYTLSDATRKSLSKNNLYYNYALGQVDRNPSEFLSQAKDFEKLIDDEKEFIKLKKMAEKNIDDLEKKYERQKKINLLNEQRELYSKALDGNLTLGEINQVEDKQLKSILTDIYEDKLPKDIKIDIESDLWSRSEEIAKTWRKNPTKAKPFTELAQFYNEVTKAPISKESKDSFIKKVLPAMQKSIEKGAGGTGIQWLGVNENIYEETTEIVKALQSEYPKLNNPLFLTKVMSDYAMNPEIDNLSKLDKLDYKQKQIALRELKNSINKYVDKSSPTVALMEKKPDEVISLDLTQTPYYATPEQRAFAKLSVKSSWVKTSAVKNGVTYEFEALVDDTGNYLKDKNKNAYTRNVRKVGE